MIRVLHTSDWHIGHRLYERDRTEEFGLFFDWLLATINSEDIDVLIVAGDVFDIAFPSNQALKLYYNFLGRLQATCCRQVVITGGNHDSVSTLHAPRDILRHMHIHVQADTECEPSEQIVLVNDSKGLPELAICAVPFLREKDIRKPVAGESYEERMKGIKDQIIAHYQTLAGLTAPLRQQGIPVIATGHLMLTGVVTSDSERELRIGNLESLENDGFLNPFHYVALGHIHRPQLIGGQEHIRYCGSPLPLSFSERNDAKTVIKISFSQQKTEINAIPVPCWRPLVQLKGTLSEITETLNQFTTSGQLNAWGFLDIRENQYHPLLHTEAQKLAQETKNPEIIAHRITIEGQTILATNTGTVQLSEFSPGQVFQLLLDRQQVENRDELLRSFTELLETTQSVQESERG